MADLPAPGVNPLDYAELVEAGLVGETSEALSVFVEPSGKGTSLRWYSQATCRVPSLGLRTAWACLNPRTGGAIWLCSKPRTRWILAGPWRSRGPLPAEAGPRRRVLCLSLWAKAEQVEQLGKYWTARLSVSLGEEWCVSCWIRPTLPDDPEETT